MNRDAVVLKPNQSITLLRANVIISEDAVVTLNDGRRLGRALHLDYHGDKVDIVFEYTSRLAL
jgi:hypothetical protein